VSRLSRRVGVEELLLLLLTVPSPQVRGE
jgi:hypothetical protein